MSSASSVAPRWRSPMWSAQAEAEGLTLLVAENKAGYFGVCLDRPGRSKPYMAHAKARWQDRQRGAAELEVSVAPCL